MDLVDRFLFRHYLEPKEQILYVIHRHWILVSQKFSKIVAIGLLLPVSLLFFFIGFQTSLSYFFYVWILLGVFYLGYCFIDWYGDAWVLTDSRILEVKWDGFFSHSATNIDFYNMLDVEYQVQGIRERVLGYGTLSMNKYAGNPIEIKGVAHPKKAAMMIGKLRLQYLATRKARTDELKDVLDQFLRDRPLDETEANL